MTDLSDLLVFGIAGIGLMILTILFYAAVVLVCGYVVLWLLQTFGILQHFGITMLCAVI